MSPAGRKRIIIIAVAVLAAAVIVAAFFLGRGCDGEENPTTGTVPRTTATSATTPAAPSQVIPVVTVEVPPTAAEPSEEPEPEPTPAPVTLEIIERSVTPQVASVGDPLTFGAQVIGEADRVVMSGSRLDGTGAFDFELTQAGTVDGVTTWTYSTPATSLTGVYRYFARAFAPDGTVVEMPGVSAWTFEITP
jgi:hypothetical protein